MPRVPCMVPILSLANQEPGPQPGRKGGEGLEMSLLTLRKVQTGEFLAENCLDGRMQNLWERTRQRGGQMTHTVTAHLILQPL